MNVSLEDLERIRYLLELMLEHHNEVGPSIFKAIKKS